MARFPAALDVAALDGSNGFALFGYDYDSQLHGGSIVAPGDVNGDGFDDVLVGVPLGGSMYDGDVYIVYGNGTPHAAQGPLSAPGVGGVSGQGGEYEYLGREVAALGDINGDGFADFAVSGEGGGTIDPVPAAYIVYGWPGGGSRYLGNLNGANGFKTNSAGATSFRPAGDLNGDGFGDLFLGNAVFFGKPAGHNEYESFATATLDGGNGFVLAGFGATSAGDVDGDGFDDLIAGNPLGDTGGIDAGEAYVVFGKADGFAPSLDPSTVDGVTGFRILGGVPGQKAAAAVSGVGDVNGDGFDDVAVSTGPGLFRIVLGRASGFADGLDLAMLGPADGFALSGATATPVAAGDVNGDTLGDLLVGTSVVFGRATPGDGDVATLDGGTGFTVTGGGLTGLQAAGDVNGDGFDDVVGLVPDARDAGDRYVHGKVYYVLGHDDGPRTWTGSAADEHYVGSAGDDVLDGAGGNDHLEGIRGSDILIGGPGDDLLDGGAGRDAVSFAPALAGVTVDLAAGSATGPGLGLDTLLSIENAIGSTGDDTLTGDARANRLEGGAGDDLLRGGAGNDTLIGGPGVDRLEGGAGNDTYVIDEAGDVLVEARSGGIDQVRSSIRFSLGGAQVENLVLIGRAALHGSGNSLDNRIVGNAGGNVLQGAGGQDALLGMAGDDRLLGDDGDDLLDGGAGNDRLEGGAGRDTATYATAASGVSVSLAIAVAQDTLAAGWDTLIGIEILQGSDHADVLSGGAGDDVLDGGKGNDLLRGGAGNDILLGGDGNDVVEFSSGFTADVTVDGGGGSDRLVLGQDLAAGVTFAAHTLAGVEAIDLAAGHGYDLTFDDGNVAAGTLLAVYGNDLGRGDGLVLDGSAETDGRFDLRGGAAGDRLVGGAGNDKLVGGSGSDRLEGGAGNDRLYGGSGADVLAGGRGADHLSGDAGADLLVFTDVGESTLVAYDTIDSWDGGDRMDLSAIDADSGQAGDQSFAFIGAAAFSAAGQLQVTTTALETWVRGDVDGDGAADLSIKLAGVQGLGSASFIL